MSAEVAPAAMVTVPLVTAKSAVLAADVPLRAPRVIGVLRDIHGYDYAAHGGGSFKELISILSVPASGLGFSSWILSSDRNIRSALEIAEKVKARFFNPRQVAVLPSPALLSLSRRKAPGVASGIEFITPMPTNFSKDRLSFAWHTSSSTASGRLR
jgi:hypothetical protein